MTRAAEGWPGPLLLLLRRFFPPLRFLALPSAVSSAPGLFGLHSPGPSLPLSLGQDRKWGAAKGHRVGGSAGKATLIQHLSSYSGQAASEGGEVSAPLWLSPGNPSSCLLTATWGSEGPAVPH